MGAGGFKYGIWAKCWQVDEIYMAEMEEGIRRRGRHSQTLEDEGESVRCLAGAWGHRGVWRGPAGAEGPRVRLSKPRGVQTPACRQERAVQGAAQEHDSQRCLAHS